MPFLKVAAPVAMVTMAACSRLGASFSYKMSQKNSEMLISLSQMKLRLKIGTSTIHSDINHLHFDTFNFPWERMRTHQKIIYLGTVLALFVVGKTGKRLYEFLQK